MWSSILLFFALPVVFFAILAGAVALFDRRERRAARRPRLLHETRMLERELGIEPSTYLLADVFDGIDRTEYLRGIGERVPRPEGPGANVPRDQETGRAHGGVVGI